MGRAKALLPFGSEQLLQRVVRLLAEVVDPIVVVAAEGQRLPDLPAEILVAVDERPEAGPLEGIRQGLSALRSKCAIAFVTGCDAPFLSPGLVLRVLEAVQEYDIAVPADADFYYPLAAAYRTRLADEIPVVLNAGHRRPLQLFERVRTRKLPLDELRRSDPELRSLINLNHPQDYLDALDIAGYGLAAEMRTFGRDSTEKSDQGPTGCHE